ncbi:MAG: DNA cytosine methyltransferase [Peptococcaceae bacterium]|nr:DNA cytosine methyltransferase [Peptococcaceae bacterium]
MNAFHEFKILHMFCGIGGAALGFQQACEEWRGIKGRFRTLAGIDCDPEACEDFENLTGARAIRMDLFERRDYIAYHGKEPPTSWREVTPSDLREAVRETPDVIFLSPPCKGFSSLLPRKAAESEKYQALNRLITRGLFLAMEAWRDDLPAIILLENVPRITSRGKDLLHTVKGLLRSYGFVCSEGLHDCGELGGLAQHRRRYLLIARLPERVPSFVYKPAKNRVKAIGEVIGPLPKPDDSAGGPMHRLPRLEWKTWKRLALIPAGGDWRDLEALAGKGWYTNSYRIIPWEEPAGTVTSGNSPSCGSVSVADPRLGHNPRKGVFRVAPWEQPATTVVGSASVRGSNGVAAVADPRIGQRPRDGAFQVGKWEKPAGPVLASTRVSGSNGLAAVADSRVDKNIVNGYGHKYQVVRFDEPAPCVAGSRFGSGTPAVADKRVPLKYSNKYQVVRFDEPSPCITGIPDVQAGAPSIADLRLRCRPRGNTKGPLGVQAWEDTASTVFGSMDVYSGPAAVADPRIPADNDRPDPPPVIISTDGTWHRPLTTYELAILQGFPTHMPDGRPLALAGKSDLRWRERIGNAVPPAAAQGMAEAILRALLPSLEGVWVLGFTDVWVMPKISEKLNLAREVTGR